MFVAHKRLFIDLFGWDVPVVEGRLEIDQFDTVETVYIIVADAEGAHEASIRLMPTTRLHMLGTIFPQLYPGGVPIGPVTWESTRPCLPQRDGADRRRELRNILISAIVDFALAARHRAADLGARGRNEYSFPSQRMEERQSPVEAIVNFFSLGGCRST